MLVNRRDLLRLGLIGAVGAGPIGIPRLAQAESAGGGLGERHVGHSLTGAPKYADDFTHFDYVTLDAPTGGRAVLSRTGTFDNLNPFIRKGTIASEVALSVDTLMKSSLDEDSTHYGMIAEWMEIAPDAAWTAFRLRDGARFHDGRDMTPADVIKSFELLIEKGHPLYAFYYADIDRVTDEGDRVVRFHSRNPENKELPHILGQINVFPAHYWETRDFGESTLEIPLGSGAYRVARFEPGRFVELERVEDYWAADLPVNRGANRFQTVRFEYFLERQGAFEAFKKGDVLYWAENRAQRWAEQFDFPAVADGRVVKREVRLDGPKGVQTLVFNTRREKFANRDVRRALSLAVDFEWTNTRVFYDQYSRPESYFQGTADLMATGLPDEAELSFLDPHRAALPPELFERPFELPRTDGSGRDRRLLRQAARMLREAGYRTENGRLIDAEGAPFTIEFLTPSRDSEPALRPFLENLKRLGVDASFRLVDAPQYVRRLQEFDFDMVLGSVRNSASPGNEQREFWGSEAADRPGGRNNAGVRDPIVDALIEEIVTAPSRAQLAAASRALDRVLLWGYYEIPQLYVPTERIAYWSTLSPPDPLPARAIGFPDVWWRSDAPQAENL